MQKQTQRKVGAHRAQPTAAQTAKGRVAFVAVATSAVGTAGFSGAAVASATNADDAHIQLAADEAQPAPVDAIPQILAIPELKPVINLSEQLHKAIAYNAERFAADLAARAPQYVKPAEGTFTSGFGARWGAMHKGVDIANALGTPILAVADGTVIDAGPASGFGQWVRIQHEDGTITVYGHMETIDVVVGQQVTAGTKIAGMGSRGYSTGSHLHFEVYPQGGGAVDPVPWLAERGITL